MQVFSRFPRCLALEMGALAGLAGLAGLADLAGLAKVGRFLRRFPRGLALEIAPLAGLAGLAWPGLAGLAGLAKMAWLLSRFKAQLALEIAPLAGLADVAKIGRFFPGQGAGLGFSLSGPWGCGGRGGVGRVPADSFRGGIWPDPRIWTRNFTESVNCRGKLAKSRSSGMAQN